MAKYKAKPRLKELLKEKGIDKQKKFALMVGVTEPTISRFDTQTRYDIDVLVSVSKALNVPIEELFYIEENEETDSK
nr:helix-turn-helix transcriptional regulator [Heyndrickxia oleronia]